MKEKIQTRIDPELYQKAMSIGKMLGMTYEADVVRYALVQFVRENIELAQRFSDLPLPKETKKLESNKWIEVQDKEVPTYVRWSIKEGATKIEYIEVYQEEKKTNYYHSLLPNDTELIAKQLENNEEGFFIDKKGYVQNINFAEDRNYVEEKFLCYHCLTHGEKVELNTLFSKKNPTQFENHLAYLGLSN